MAEVDTADLALLALAGDRPDDSNVPALSVVDLSDCLEMGAETMADRIALLSTLSDLTEAGLVAERTDDQTRQYVLTDTGRQRARERFDALADRPIELRNGESREIRLREVEGHLPAPAVPRALARMTAEGILYLEETVESDFVDREDECAMIEQALAATREGNGGALLITGEAGIGKTTLVETALDGADQARVLTGVAQEATDEPYRVVREAIEPALADSPFERPALEVDDPEDLSGLRTSLFADVADALVDLASDRPVVLFLDDLHAAGPATVELVAFLSRRARNEPVLLVVTARPVADDDDSLADLVARWETDSDHRRAVLSPFSREHTHELIQATVGTRRVPEAFTAVVHERTGGVPLFVTETCNQMLERGVLAPEHDVFPSDPAEITGTETVEATIRERLDALDESGRKLLQTAALLGEEFDPGVLVDTTALDRQTVSEYVDLLNDIDVLSAAERNDASTPSSRVSQDSESSESRRRYRFHSTLVRDTIAADCPDDRRERIHGEIAAVLSERSRAGTGAESDERVESGEGAKSEAGAGTDPEQSATVAHHFERAGEDERALAAWQRAAGHAESVYAHEVARRHYERALSLARRLDHETVVLDCLEAIGDSAFLTGDQEQARRAYEYVETEADSVTRRQRALRKIARHQRIWSDEAREALETLDRALELGGDEHTTAEECHLLIERGKLRHGIGEFDDCVADLERASALAERLDEKRLLARALTTWVGGRAVQGRQLDDTHLEQAERALSIAESVGDGRLRMQVLKMLGLIHTERGNRAGAQEQYRRSMEQAREIGDRRWALGNQSNLAISTANKCLTGDEAVSTAIETAEAVIEEARALGAERIHVGVTNIRGSLAWQGTYEYDRAVEYFEDGLEMAQRLNAIRFASGAAGMLGEIHEWAGEFDRAWPHAEEAVEMGRESEIPDIWSSAHWLCGRLHVHEDEHEAALREFERAVEIASGGNRLQAELVSRANLVEGLLADGQVEAALETAEWIEARLTGEVETEQDPGDLTDYQAFWKPRIEGWRAVGRAKHAGAKYESARCALEEARTIARSQADSYRQARVEYDLARVYLDCGESAKARDVFEAADERMADLGQFGEELDRRNSALAAAIREGKTR